MIFALTDELTQKIVQALENQDEKFVVCAESESLVSRNEAGAADDENFYSLPDWNSEDGFELRQSFVSNLHAPVAKDKLQQILHSGRGVFKSFKNTLKEYPQVEKLWHSFKNRKMNAYIHAWYNELCEIWGLEKLEEEPEDMEDLLKDDFVFVPYDYETHGKSVIDSFRESSFGFNWELSGTVNEAVFELWQHHFFYGKDFQNGFVCKTLSDEFAGSIVYSPVVTRMDSEKVCVLTAFFVPEKFRGLGIGSQLCQMLVDSLKVHGFRWILITSTGNSALIEKLFTGYNFKKTDTGFAVEIHQ